MILSESNNYDKMFENKAQPTILKDSTSCFVESLNVSG